MLNYTEKPQNTYIHSLNGLGDNGNWKLWTSFGSKNDSCQLEFLSTRRSAAGRRANVTTQHTSMMYSTSNRKFKYDTKARNFAVTINGSVSLTSYFDEKYRY